MMRTLRQKVVDDFHLPRKSKFLMFVTAKLTHCDKSVDMLELSLDVPRITPVLGRAVMVQYAAQALTARTWFSIVAPKNMTGADQPVLVRHIEFECSSGG